MERETTKIAIIVPIYNAEEYLGRCVDSILSQSYENFLLLLIDDGSSDGSYPLCKAIAEKDKRVVILHKENGGAASARNMGIDWVMEHTGCEWICFIDSDDYVHPDYIRILYHGVIEIHTMISMCTYTEIEEEFVRTKANTSYKRTTPEDLWCDRQLNCTVPFSKLFHVNCFQCVRFPEGVIFEDEFTLYKILFAQKEIAFADIPLYYYYQSEGSVMRSDWNPNKLLAIDASYEQMLFFHKYGFKRAEMLSAYNYIMSLGDGYTILSEKNIDQSKRTAIRKRLKQALFRYGRALNLVNEEHSWLYYIGWPITTNVFKKIRRIVMRSHI